jgi:hypothetical protein
MVVAELRLSYPVSASVPHPALPRKRLEGSESHPALRAGWDDPGSLSRDKGVGEVWGEGR